MFVFLEIRISRAFACIVWFGFLASTSTSAEINTARPPQDFAIIATDLDGQRIAIAEQSASEAHDHGSYVVRLYAAAPNHDAFDRFVAGSVSARLGVLDALMFADIDLDGDNEVIISTRNIMTGALSADAHAVADDQLSIVARVRDVANARHLVEQLRQEAKRKTRRAKTKD